MKIGSPKETHADEKRVALTPESAAQLRKLGHECLIETGAGLAAGFSDESYRAAGVGIVASSEELWQSADVVAKVRPPSTQEVALLSSHQTLVSFFYPAQNGELLEHIRDAGCNTIAMDMIPRISRAQKMDALSSMANIAGYRAVIEAGSNFGRFFTGQVTAAGKVAPAKVLVIGAGVAGLSAIGTAAALGAITFAFDVRPEVAEQIESMGAQFVYLDFSGAQEDGAETGGYASPSSPAFRAAQLRRFRELASEVDVVITTALIPGREAPKLWLADMVAAMKSGSVIVDLAAERGGNCELTLADQKVVTPNGVTVIGYTDYPSRMAAQASTLYANNIRHLIADLSPAKDGELVHNMEDDVIRGATVAFRGTITYPPPPPRIQAIAAQRPRPKVAEQSPEQRRVSEKLAFNRQARTQALLLASGCLLLLLAGSFAPVSFMSHFVVFVLACFIGFQVIWNVSHSLHTPLMAVTSAVSGIVIVGALLQMNSQGSLVTVLAAVSILVATVNIVGGFLVTRRMLAMFQKS